MVLTVQLIILEARYILENNTVNCDLAVSFPPPKKDACLMPPSLTFPGIS